MVEFIASKIDRSFIMRGLSVGLFCVLFVILFVYVMFLFVRGLIFIFVIYV